MAIRDVMRLRLRLAILGTCCLLLAGPQRAFALDELPLKAAVIFNLLMFVEWPGEAELPPATLLPLCADRHAPLWPHLRQLNARPVRQLRLEVRDAAAPEARGCRVWVLEDGAARADAVRGTPPQLTIAAGTNTGDAGAVISLHLAGSRLQFDVDLVAARQQGLLLSSKVLRLARTVHE